MKTFYLIGILAGFVILLLWLTTGERPDDWFIVALILLTIWDWVGDFFSLKR